MYPKLTEVKINKNVKDFLIYPIGLSIIGGFILGVILCRDCWEDRNLMIKQFFYQGSFWFVFTFGSQLAIYCANKFVNWLEAPLKRFLLGLGLMVVFTVVLFLLDFFFFQVVVYNNSVEDVISYVDGWIFISPILITFGVNLFFHSREFLLSWRQNSIDYERLKTEQIATQYDSLKNQVNPHFLFNSLNALTSLVYDDQDKAVEFIRKLSKVYRYVLDTKDKEVVEITEELKFLESYLYLQKIRFEENLNFKIDISEKAKSMYIIPISLQMLMENAIKHNIVSQSKPLFVSVTEEDGYLVIANNLQEKLHKDSTGIGLSNIKARFNYLTKKEVIVNKTEDRFEVRLPLIKSIN